MTRQELLELQTCVDTQDKEKSSSNNTEFEKIDNTPFTLIKTKKGWIIVMGNYQASNKTFNDKNEAELYIHSKPWELLLISSYIFNEEISNLKTKNNE